jgi:HK97 family phage prohead protease
MDNTITRHTTQHDTSIVERSGGAKEICGYGAIYFDGTPATEYDLGGGLVERIQRGCFDAAIAERQNTEVRYNHSPDFVLGDVEGGAVVRSDEKGLRYSVPFDPQDPDHAKVKSKIEKGLVKGSSFCAVGPTYRYADDNGTHVAWLTSVKVLKDVAPVNSPAYKGAPAMMRSAELDEGYKEWLRLKLETEKRLAKLKK